MNKSFLWIFYILRTHGGWGSPWGLEECEYTTGLQNKKKKENKGVIASLTWILGNNLEQAINIYKKWI